MSWKNIVKNEEVTKYFEEPQEVYERFMKNYEKGKPMAQALLKKFNAIKDLFNDFYFDQFYDREERLKDEIVDALNSLYTEGRESFSDIKGQMRSDFEMFESGEYSDSDIAREKRDEMEKMMDEIYWDLGL